MTHAEQILNFINSKKDGARLTEVQTFICNEFLHTQYESKYHRGLYCKGLYDSNSHVGLFNGFCKKINNKWKVISPIAPPFYPKLSTWNTNKNLILNKRTAYILKQKLMLL